MRKHYLAKRDKDNDNDEDKDNDNNKYIQRTPTKDNSREVVKLLTALAILAMFLLSH